MIEELPSWANNIISALGGGGVMAYLVKRRLTADKNNDATDTKTQSLIDSLRDALSHERETNHKQQETIETLAKERNEAVRNSGRLEAMVEVLQKQVESLSLEVNDQKRIISEMTRQFMLMREHMAAHGVTLIEGDKN